MSVKVLQMSVFLFHFISLYFILRMEKMSQRKEKDKNRNGHRNDKTAREW